jgi:hypothetical protein
MNYDQAAKDKREFDAVIAIKESTGKLAESAGILLDDSRVTHSLACRENPVLAILMLDIVKAAAELNRKVNEIQGAL